MQLTVITNNVLFVIPSESEESRCDYLNYGILQSLRSFRMTTMQLYNDNEIINLKNYLILAKYM